MECHPDGNKTMKSVKEPLLERIEELVWYKISKGVSYQARHQVIDLLWGETFGWEHVWRHVEKQVKDHNR